jgi:hypothetical protein
MAAPCVAGTHVVHNAIDLATVRTEKAMHLADYMKLNELTDDDVAKAIKRTRPTVSRIRRNKGRPDWDTLIVLRKWSKGEISADDFVIVR